MASCPKSFRWMSYEEAHAFEQRAAQLGVSEVARSARGFMRQFERNKSVASFCRQPVHEHPGQTWGQTRRNFIARHLPQYKKRRTERRWLAMAMWAFKAPAP